MTVRNTGWSPRIAVIGSGISGILTGIKLLERGYRNFKIFEKAPSAGGTWRDNTYPGVACDVPAHLYVYSFEPNPDWTYQFPAGEEIRGYYERTAHKYGVTRHFQFGMEIASCTWTGADWVLTTSGGEIHRADIVVSAVGRLHHPKYPEIVGLETFEGPCFHSARWNHGVETEGRRVGVIGGGSSGTQIVAALSRSAARLIHFQRTAQWVLSVPNPPLPRWLRLALRHIPFAARYYYRRLDQALADRTSVLQKGDRSAYDLAAQASLNLIRDPDLKRKLTPDYAPGCKRMVRSPDFHEAIQRPNVDLVTEPIRSIEAKGVRTADGRLHELDVLVLATGFKVDAFMRPMAMCGREGVTLDDLWRDHPVNYKSVALPGMPNFFMINGPYSPGGSASIVSIAEIGVSYVMQCIDRIARDRVALDPDPIRSVELLEEVRQRASKTVWVTGGCNSWYLGKDGVPIVNPATLAELADDLRAPDFADFRTVTLAPGATERQTVPA